MTHAVRRYAPVAMLILTLAACVPRVGGDAFASAVAQEAEQAAHIAFHRMEIGRLETGAYTTNVLVDLTLSRGVRWTLIDFSADSYRLRFTIDAEPTIGWLVSPSGVRRIVLSPTP